MSKFQVAIIIVVAALLTLKVIYAIKNNQKIKLGFGPLYLEA